MTRAPAEAWDLARRLVTGEGRTYAEASAETGIPESTLQKRAAKEDWQRQRGQSETYIAGMRALKVAMHCNLTKRVEAGEKIDPQELYALIQLERAIPEHRYQTAREDPKARLAVAINLLDELVDYLAEQAPDVLAGLRPHINPFSRRLEEAAL